MSISIGFPFLLLLKEEDASDHLKNIIIRAVPEKNVTVVMAWN